MEMMYTFMRGQVWYWEDPVYGKKDETKLQGIVGFDSTVRFSRYVIINQTTESINSNSALVIPCSSQHRSEFDVLLKFPNASTISYSRASAIFPADLRSLKMYICTLTEQTMELIENSLKRVLFPGTETIPYPFSIPVEELQELPQELPQESIRSVVHEVITRNSKNKRNKIAWNDENIKLFMETYISKGMDVVCEKFNIKPSTAQTYFYQWARKKYPKKSNKLYTFPKSKAN